MANKDRSNKPEPARAVETKAVKADEPKAAAKEAKPAEEEVVEETTPDAPVIEEGGLEISLENRRDDTEKVEKDVEVARFIGNKLWVMGEGLTSVPGEVILDVKRADGSDHARFSSWSDEPEFSLNVPGLTGTGAWLIHAEQVVTAVGEGNEDGLPLILESNELELELT